MVCFPAGKLSGTVTVASKVPEELTVMFVLAADRGCNAPAMSICDKPVTFALLSVPWEIFCVPC
jgi:hypothetical protein